MNEHQQEALQRAHEILGEHFENAVILVSTDVYVGDRLATAHELLFHGGAMTALGLLTWGGDQIMERDRNASEGRGS
jgi:hypothetical protein